MKHDDISPKLRPTNSSGYQGVSWNKGAGKWMAYIRAGGARRYLGLFATAEAASAAYVQATMNLRPNIEKPDPKIEIEQCLNIVKQLYATHGIKALSTRFIQKSQPNAYEKLRRAGFRQAELLSKLGLNDEFQAWRTSARNYRGVTKPKWSWEVAVAAAKQLKESQGDLPTVQWCRENGYSSLTNTVHQSGRQWEDLRVAVGCPPGSSFYESRNHMRWRSRPEASLSNFLYARGIEHKRGELYPVGYSEQTGRRFGSLDMHFISTSGAWIDVEVWGDLSDKMSKGRYKATRAAKEKWQSANPNFLGIQYMDCLSDVRLSEILEPYIGVIEPFQFDRPVDRLIETSHWSDADELLVSCREFAAKMPGGIFPSEDWLRKRGKYAGRSGPAYNTMAIRVNEWLGGTRTVRKLLGHSHASTIAWTPELAIAAWNEFEQKHGRTPSQGRSGGRKNLAPEIVAEASKIYEAVRLRGLLDKAREGRSARKIFWTRDQTIEAWQDFCAKYNRTPSECMSPMRRRTMPREITDEATRIYSAARRLELLDVVRSK